MAAETAQTMTLAGSGGLEHRYASALYAFAEETGALDQVAGEIESLGKLIEESADFRRLIETPLIDAAQQRKAALAALEAQGFSTAVRNFVGVVAANRRLSALPRFVSAFAALLAARRGVVTAEVATAHPLTDLQRTQLSARLTEAGYPNVRLAERVDPSLLGGLVLKIGARLYDTSLRSRLQRLTYAMKGAA